MTRVTIDLQGLAGILSESVKIDDIVLGLGVKRFAEGGDYL